MAPPNRRISLGDEADVPLGAHLLRRHRAAEHLDLARVLADQPHEDAHGRRLAGAVGSDEAHDLALLEAERDVVEREEP